MDVFNVNYDQDDIDMKKCHAYNPYKHDNIDKKKSLSRLDANRCKVTIKLIINLIYLNNKNQDSSSLLCNRFQIFFFFKISYLLF